MPRNPLYDKYVITGSTFFTDDDYEIKTFIEKYGTKKILKHMDTEKVETFLRSKKLNKLKNGKC